MTEGQLIVIGLRLVLPLLILRLPLVGGLLALVIDALDVVIVEWFGPGGMGDHYAAIDKGLDLYYLALEAWVVWRWWDNRPARLAALALFGWRVVGVALFELTGARALLFVFPNLFEYLFLGVLIAARFLPRLEPKTWRAVLIWILVLLGPKLGQEYLLHIAEAQPWDWVKRNILGQ